MSLLLSNHTLTADASSKAQLMIRPSHGGRIASFELAGRQLLVTEGDDALAWGCYPMVPFAGRVNNGQLHFEGVDYQLPPTLGDHAIHGYGHVSEWTVVEATDIDVELLWAFCSPWPWAGSASQRFSLSTSALTLSLAVTAVERQPVSFGWHPWFRRDVGASSEVALGFAAESMYELDDNQIPTGHIIEPTAGPWDNCFSDVQQPLELRWGDTAITLSSDTDFWVVYTEPEHALCVEPQTGFPNDVNMAPRILEAGETARAQFTLSW